MKTRYTNTKRNRSKVSSLPLTMCDVDFDALRQKYTNISKNSSKGIPPPPSGSLDAASAPSPNINAERLAQQLDKYKICIACQGLGVNKTIYNHMVMEKSCETCDGDCIIKG